MGFLYNLQKKLFSIIGDTQYFGWKHPLWFAVCPPGYQLKGEHYRLIRPRLQPGDILLQRFEGWIDKWFIPGFWNHAAIYLGNEKEQVVHAVSEGVLVEDVINFMRTDHMVILRNQDEELAQEAVKRALSIVGLEYDFNFDFSDNKRFACTEVIDFCYPNVYEKSKSLEFIGASMPMLTPDDIFRQTVKIWDSREHKAQMVNTSITPLSDKSSKFKVMMRVVD